MQVVDLRPPDLPPPPAWVFRVLAGIDTGAVAGLILLVWFAVHSRLLREPWWAKFNLAAAPFFGERIFVMGPGLATLAGAALLFLLFCLLSVAYCLLACSRGAVRASLLAALWMTAWHVFADRWFWPLLDSSAGAWFPWSATVPAHAAMAILLLRCPARYRRLRALLAPEPVSAQPPGEESTGASPGMADVSAGQAETPAEPPAPPAADC